jgi:hypothetical protein
VFSGYTPDSVPGVHGFSAKGKSPWTREKADQLLLGEKRRSVMFPEEATTPSFDFGNCLRPEFFA